MKLFDEQASKYELLDKQGIQHEITEHGAVYNMDALHGLSLHYPEAMAKNLFVHDSKKDVFALITVKGDKRVNLNQFRKEHGFK